MKIVKPSVELIYITSNSEKLIEMSARTCYQSVDKITDISHRTFNKTLLSNKHTSTLEHAYASFKIITDRGVLGELSRHRFLSLSVESTRYCCYAKDKFDSQITVIAPECLIGKTEYLFFIEACEKAEQEYIALLEMGYKPEIARAVLPLCLKTELIASANFREWKHIIELRTSEQAHPQIREIVSKIEDILTKEAPSIFEK